MEMATEKIATKSSTETIQVSRWLPAARQRLGNAMAAAVATLWLVLAGCQPAAEGPEPGALETPSAETDLAARAAALTRDTILVDTHVDVPYRLVEKMDDVSVATEGGDFDYPRAKEGGLDAPFMSIYIPASYQPEADGGAKAFADELITMMEGIVEAAPEKFAIATTPTEIEEQFAAGLISLPMGMENGAPIEEDLANLQHFFDRGIRYITLTHSKNNQICDSSYEDAGNRRWKGLSPFGRQVVAEMNRLGMMIDISHVSDDAFYQVLEITRAPVIASHSSVRAFTPGFERNMDDAMIRALAENGGVIQINFGSAFLTEASNTSGSARWAAIGAFVADNGLDSDNADDRARIEAFEAEYMAENPRIYADLADVVAHIDHVVELVGIDHVGIGSDYDGVGDSLPTGLKDVSTYPNLVRALLEKGYSEDDVRKILSGNILRVWRQVEAVASQQRAEAA